MVDNSCSWNLPTTWLEKPGSVLTISNKLCLVHQGNETRMDSLLLISKWARKWLTLFKWIIKSQPKYLIIKCFPNLCPLLGKNNMRKNKLAFTERLLCARYFINFPVLVKRLILRRFDNLFDNLFEVGEGRRNLKRKKISTLFENLFSYYKKICLFILNLCLSKGW